MFYDLPEPMEFVSAISQTLDPQGVWHFEQSYLPTMLEMNSYDTLCHEHLEYYALSPILFMLNKAKMKIVDLQFNLINGGSIAITAAHRDSDFPEASKLVAEVIASEKQMGLDQLDVFQKFANNVEESRSSIQRFFVEAKAQGKKVFGYGASTKGNVLLQHCGIGTGDMPYIAEVNSDKFGKFTPGSLIPIVSEEWARSQNPDYFFVLPWHFRDFIVGREKSFFAKGGKLVFPLPNLEIVS
jgi:hypothetical protein